MFSGSPGKNGSINFVHVYLQMNNYVIYFCVSPTEGRKELVPLFSLQVKKGFIHWLGDVVSIVLRGNLLWENMQTDFRVNNNNNKYLWRKTLYNVAEAWPVLYFVSVYFERTDWLSSKYQNSNNNNNKMIRKTNKLSEERLRTLILRRGQYHTSWQFTLRGDFRVKSATTTTTTTTTGEESFHTVTKLRGTNFKSYTLFVVIVDHFYIRQLSALEQTHCAFVACDSEWVTGTFYSAFIWISIEVVYLQRYLVVAWLVLVPCEIAAASAHVLCTPYNHAPVYTVTIRKAIYAGACLCLAVTCHLHFW